MSQVDGVVVVEEDAVDSGRVGPLAHVALLRNPLRLWRDGLRFYGTGCEGSTTRSGRLHRDSPLTRARAGLLDYALLPHGK